ncbi:MAG: F0F1 ATP synthase subunit A [Flavobacteriales bacterium]|nr:F0F1 ATP synthase subunit A [Flavobacteriales bacterium]
MIKGLFKRFTLTLVLLGLHQLTIAQAEGEVNIDNSDHSIHETHSHHSHTEGEHSEFVPGDFIIHHIADANKIHFFGEGADEISAPLPMIIYVEGEGVDVFMSSAFKSESESHDSHAPSTAQGPSTGVLYTKDEHGITGKNENGELVEIWDVSITKSVFGMLLIITCIILLFTRVAKSYSRNPGLAPTGVTNFLEPLILFVRDDIAYPVIGKEKSKKFLPFLLTTFFFILGCNLLGLIPFIGGFNITGTIGVTIILALLVFIITTINSNKHYWGHILWPPGVPHLIKLIVVPIEMLSVFIKPTVLMIRLTANMSAGHIIILSFISLVFIFNQNFGTGAGIGIGVFSTLFMIFMYFLEILVAFLQAYVFTLLAAIYFSEATQEPHH